MSASRGSIAGAHETASPPILPFMAASSATSARELACARGSVLKPPSKISSAPPLPPPPPPPPPPPTDDTLACPSAGAWTWPCIRLKSVCSSPRSCAAASRCASGET
eukprot:983516-Prymnesium_polylepis.1